MTKLPVLFALWLGAGVFGGCGESAASDADANDQPDSGISINAFTGTWQASVYRYTNAANDTEQFDVVADGGEFRMAVLSRGRVRTFLTIGTVEDEWDGLLTTTGTTLTSTPVESGRPTQVYEFTLDGDALTLANDDDEFDFARTGADAVPATVDVALTRN